MNKINNHNKNLRLFLIIISIIIFILLIINIIYVYKYINYRPSPIEEIKYTEKDDKYDSTKKYYTNIKYDHFKKLYKSQDISTIAIVDNSSKSYNKFIELINKLSYYKETKIYLLETSKLSRKNEIAFYNTDDRLKKLETNYIITISNNKILSITTFEESEINKLIKGLGE